MKAKNTGKQNATNESINRAEDVRRRRTQRSTTRVTEAKQRATHPVHVRPVIMRGNAFGTPIHRRTSKQAPRRAYYVTMNRAAGTEVRLPSIPMPRPGWRLLSGLIAILAMVGIYYMTSSDMFRLESVQVNGLQRISSEDVNATIDLDDVLIIEVDTQQITEKLAAAYPELVDISVGVVLPNLVSVTASERQPVVIWQKGDKTQWIDAEGVVFSPRGDAGSLVRIHSEEDLPMKLVITEPADEAEAEDEAQEGSGSPIPVTGKGTVEVSLLEAAQALYQKLPPDTTILYTSRDGLGWNDAQGWQVYIGNDLNHFEAKFSMYQKIVEHVNNQGQQPVLVSVEHLDAPFYRLEP